VETFSRLRSPRLPSKRVLVCRPEGCLAHGRDPEACIRVSPARPGPGFHPPENPGTLSAPVSRLHRHVASGRGSLRSALRSLAGGSQASAVALLIALFPFPGRTAQAQAPSRQAAAADSGVINIAYSWGVGAKYHLDTNAGTVAIDCAPPLSGPLKLTQEDKLSILALADSIGFFTLPEFVGPPTPAGGHRYLTEPCERCRLSITDGVRANTIYYDFCYGPFAEAKELTAMSALIQAIVTEKDDYKRLMSSCEHLRLYR
jgi:hypothetical protein